MRNRQQSILRVPLALLLLSASTIVPALGQSMPGVVLGGDQLPLFLPLRGDEDKPMRLAKDNDELKFKLKVLAKRGPVLVEFVLPSCAACNSVTPSIIDLVTRYNGEVGYVRLDLNKNLRASFKYDVPEVPAVLLFRDGQLEQKFMVYKTEMQPELIESIEREVKLARLERDARVAVAEDEPLASAAENSKHSQPISSSKLQSSSPSRSQDHRTQSDPQVAGSIDRIQK